MKHITSYAVLIIIIVAMSFVAMHQRSELTRVRANWRAEVQDLGRQQDVTQRELTQMYDVADSLHDKLNIKPKQITHYIKVPIQYRDTGSVKVNTCMILY